MIRTTLIAAAALLALSACASTPASPDAAASPEAPDGAIRAVPMPSAALAMTKAPRRIIFASCAQQNEDQSMYDVMLAADPDLVILMGDNVYGDVRSNDPALPELKAAYMRLAQSEPFARLRAKVPVLTVWDDHDYGLNDAGAEFKHREAAERLFDFVWAIPESDARRARPGVYGSWMLGPEGAQMQIIMLDTRYFRSPLKATDEMGAPGKERYLPDNDPSKTMLGDQQWAWLEGELRKPAKHRLLVSSIQVVADGHGWEAWRLLPAERERLVRLLRDTGATNTLILSGDRHLGGFYKRETDGLTLNEVTSSSINLPAARWRAESGETRVEPGPYRLGDPVYDANFGLIEVAEDGETFTVTLRGRDGRVLTPAGM